MMHFDWDLQGEPPGADYVSGMDDANQLRRSPAPQGMRAQPGPDGAAACKVPRLKLNTGCNKMTPRDITPREATDAPWEVRPVVQSTPRLKTNKISSASARSLSTVRTDDSHVVYPKSSPVSGRRSSPRAGGLPSRFSPRSDTVKASPPLASLAEIKNELFGLEMRRMIRDELRSVLSERQVADHRSRSPATSPAARHDPEDGTVDGEHFGHLHDFHEGAEDMLGLHDKEEDDAALYVSVASEGFSKERLTARTGRPPNVYKSVMSMLEVSVSELTSWDRCMLSFHQRLSTLGKESAPTRTDILSRVADSCYFDLLVHLVIVLNIAAMAFQADHDIRSLDYEFESMFRMMEVFFLLFYVIEFLVKFARSRWLYFYGVGYGWNWVDFIVLVFSVPFALQIDGAMDALPGKIIRMLRLTRALRVLQLVSFFKKMSALLHSLTASVSTLICSLSLLAVFLFMFSLFFVMRIGLVLKDAGPSLTTEERQAIFDSFGSILVSMLTLLKVCTGGTDWSEVFNLLAAAGWETQTMFVAYIAFSQMALLNIVLGLFVEQAMKSMASDKLELAHRHFHEQNEFRTTIKDLFHMAGIDISEKITLAEWRKCQQKHRLYNFLDFHGFMPSEVDQYFELLSGASDDGTVDVNHFVNGCIRMKGGASSFSVYEVLLAVSELDEKLQTHLDKMQSELMNRRVSYRGGRSSPPRQDSGATSATRAGTPGYSLP